MASARSACNTILTALGLAAAWLRSGRLIIELVFDIPCLTRLVVDAVLRRAGPVVRCALLLIADLAI